MLAIGASTGGIASKAIQQPINDGCTPIHYPHTLIDELLPVRRDLDFPLLLNQPILTVQHGHIVHQ